MDDQFPKENFDAGASNAVYGANQVVQINHAGGAYGGGYSGASSSGGTCFKCKQPGHWARECPNAMVAAPPAAAPPAAPPPPAFAGAKRGREQMSEVQKIFLGGVHSTLKGTIGAAPGTAAAAAAADDDDDDDDARM